MKNALRNFYYFLPTQLLLLHFRKYQMLLAFWIIMFLIITGRFAQHFGAKSLFLAPEYLGSISFVSMFLLGCAMCVFMMTWHITTFIIHSRRIPYMGATRHAFLVYCINNSIVPLLFLISYSIVSVGFQWNDEQSPVGLIILLQLGFYFGFVLVLLVSFAYFFRVSRNYFKSVLIHITNPSRIREIIPYDSLDREADMIPAHSYISMRLRIRQSTDVEAYHPRVLNAVLTRHHRNVIFAAFFSYILLLLMGIFIDQPLLRVPAGAGFLLLFAIIMGVVGAFKYFLKSWETIGWVLFVALLSALVHFQVFDLRSIAYGVNYHSTDKNEPMYSYGRLRRLFTPRRFVAERSMEEIRLRKWKTNTLEAKPTLVVVAVSGGGSRSAYWTFRTLQYIDSASQGKLFRNTVMVTGASGGMIGAAYWRSLHDAHQRGQLKNPYLPQYQENIGKDLLNAITFSLASVDLISPFQKIRIAGNSYTRDRGYAMEQELIRNTDGLLDKNIDYFRVREANGTIPMFIINGTIVNDGRKLMIANQPIGYLTQPEYSLANAAPPIDAVDFSTFFRAQDPGSLRLSSALRMNASFPYLLPAVKLPSKPRLNIMDAGMRDNYGIEVGSRYMFVLRKWMAENAGNVVFLQIRDTRENDVTNVSDQSSSLMSMLGDPLFVIYNKWEAFQSYAMCYMKEYTPGYLQDKLRLVTLQYVPQEPGKVASLNFHLTKKEQNDLYQSVYSPNNKAAIDTILRLLGTPPLAPDKIETQ